MLDSISKKAGSLDLGKFRIAPNSNETLGSIKLVTHVSVGKPGKGRFFRSSKADPNSIDVLYF